MNQIQNEECSIRPVIQFLPDEWHENQKEKGGWLGQNGNSQAPYMWDHKLYVPHFHV